MKPVSLLILVLSLAGNATLGFLYFRAGTSGTNAVRSPVVSSGGANASHEASASDSTAAPVNNAGTQSPATWQSLHSGDDLHAMIANLRAAGFPPRMIRAMVERMVGDQFADRYAAVAPPYWKRYYPTREQVAAKQKLDEERSKAVDALLGDDTRPSANLLPADRRARYGDLPDDKVDAVARIEHDYEQVAREARAGGVGNMVDRMSEMRDQQALLEQQRLADLAAVLTPEELEEYKLHNSIAASQAMSRLRSVDVSEAEFEAVYEAQQSYDDATANLKMVGEVSPDVVAKQGAAMNAFNDQVKAALPDDRFYQYLETSDFRYAQLTKSLSAFPTVTPDATYQLFKLQQDTQVALSMLYQDKTIPQEQRNAQRIQLLGTASEKVDALLGPEAAAAYKKQGMGRMFVVPAPTKSGGG